MTNQPQHHQQNLVQMASLIPMKAATYFRMHSLYILAYFMLNNYNFQSKSKSIHHEASVTQITHVHTQTCSHAHAHTHSNTHRKMHNAISALDIAVAAYP